jgi:hypothetical protein
MTVKVRGLREVQRGVRKLSDSVGKDLTAELKTAAEPVAASARQKLTRYQGVSLNVQPVALMASVRVRQQQRKVTGLRGDFGALQMRTAFRPALEENQERVVRNIEQVVNEFVDDAGL